jgi:hypothetical protein
VAERMIPVLPCRPLAERLLSQAEQVQLTDQDREALRDDLHRAAELAQALAEPP